MTSPGLNQFLHTGFIATVGPERTAGGPNGSDSSGQREFLVLRETAGDSFNRHNKATQEGVADLSRHQAHVGHTRISASRRRIVVIDDELATRAQSELEKDPSPEELAPVQEEGETSFADRLKGRLRRRTDDAVAGVVTTVIKMREAALDVAIISDSEAAAMTFPPGHPARGVLYVAHPVMPGWYYPAAQFHRFVVEHKFAEAMDLLMELGARTMEIELIRGYKKQDVLDILAAIPLVRIGGKAEKEQDSTSHIHCLAELEGSTEPRLPDDLVWYPHEPLWRKLGENRLEKRLKKFQLAVRHLDSMTVDKELEAAAKAANLRIGGQHIQHEEVVIRINGEFATSSDVTGGGTC
ncbi:MAG: hypothetical protein M3N53_03450 [Actinomycetota bacterium]|nr:hypothetical protein [Actinomycetota bacterium]